MDGYYVGDLMQLLQIMVERGLANALERRCGGGDHCCRFQNILYVYSIFFYISNVWLFGFSFRFFMVFLCFGCVTAILC